MKLIADSGSTKTSWALAEGGQQRWRTQGLNPLFCTPDDLAETLKQVKSEIGHTAGALEIHFYGAGCAGERGKEIMSHALRTVFDQADIEVQGDMLAACRATCGREHGVVAILGTGSNSCRYDGTHMVENLAALGYALDCDEGSGNAIGRRLMKGYLRETMPDKLRRLWEEEIGLGKEEILERTYHQPYPNRFMASTATFAKKHEAEPWMAEMLDEVFAEFFEEQILHYESKEHRLNVVGSIGTAFERQIAQTAERYGWSLGKVVQEPIEGLVDYHRQAPEQI